jgi:hypothetical protein
MEYPLGANRASGACKPTCEWDPKTGAEAPPGQCGFSKAPTTAQVEVSLCAPLPPRSLPAPSRGRKTLSRSRFFSGTPGLQNRKRKKTPCLEVAAPPMVALAPSSPSIPMHARDGTGAQKSSQSASAVGHCGTMASAQRGKRERKCWLFQLTWAENWITLAFVIAASRTHGLHMGACSGRTHEAGAGRSARRQARRAAFRGGSLWPSSRDAWGDGEERCDHWPDSPAWNLEGTAWAVPH